MFFQNGFSSIRKTAPPNELELEPLLEEPELCQTDHKAVPLCLHSSEGTGLPTAGTETALLTRWQLASCFLCDQKSETSEHLFILWYFTKQLLVILAVAAFGKQCPDPGDKQQPARPMVASAIALGKWTQREGVWHTFFPCSHGNFGREETWQSFEEQAWSMSSWFRRFEQKLNAMSKGGATKLGCLGCE